MIKGWRKNTYSVKCKDGSKKQMYRNPDDAFPLHIGSFDSNFAANVKAEVLPEGELSGGLSTKVEALLVGLNDINNGVMMAFRSAYIGYSADPCGKGVEFLRTEIVKINEEQRRLKALAMQIRGYVELAKTNSIDAKDLTNRYIDLLNNMRSTSVGGLGTIEAIELANQAALSMMGDE